MSDVFDELLDSVPPEKRREVNERLYQAAGEILADVRGESAQAQRALKPGVNVDWFKHASARLSWLNSKVGRLTTEEQAERKQLSKQLTEAVKQYPRSGAVGSDNWR